MSYYEDYKTDFTKRYFYDKELISEEEYNKLDEKDRLFAPGLRECDNQYFRIQSAELSDNEINNFILMKLLDNTSTLKKKLNTIKNIAIFWLVITLIGFLFQLFSVINIR